MRANQAAIQRRVNTPRVQTQPSYGGNVQPQQTPPSVSNNGYTPYPQPTSNNNNISQSNANYGQTQQPQPVSQQNQTSGKMPQGLNPQQQLQFILNVLGERISKLELNFASLSNSPDNSSVSNPFVLQNAITNHPEFKTLKDSITRLQSLPPSPQQTTSSSSNVSPDVIAEIQTNVDTLFEQVENNDSLLKIQEELQTRTELLAIEINQVKDMVLQLQSTVINTLLPAIVSEPPSLPPVPVSTLESFTEAPLNIIPEDPLVNAAVLEENLENAELPTITEPLTY
jgi:hypothetical protein